MTRILADLPDDDIKWLDARAAEEGKSRASVLREAVRAYKAQAPSRVGDWIGQGFGLWARGTAVDITAADLARRAEWTRAWDADFQEMRSAAPDHFTAEDEKDHAHYLALIEAAKTRQAKSAE
jgi:hypothetical protein